MVWPFASKPTKPTTVETDTIVPLYHLDSSTINRAIVLVLTLRFDDVLDIEKLRSSLERLVEIGGWRKHGARIRQNDAGKLEYHIPVEFTEKRPGVILSNVKYDVPICEHALASKLPKATTKPSVQGDPREFKSLARRPGAPERLEDYLYSDEPQLSAHVVSFEDATLVSLTWGHWHMDAMGMKGFINSWTAVLNGQEADVKPLTGFEEGPIEKLCEQPTTEESILAPKQLKGLAMIGFVIRYIFELLWYRSESQRVVCLPASYLTSMREAALSELSASSHSLEPEKDKSTGEEKPNAKPFLSDGDILCAWWTRLALIFLPPSSSRTVLIMNAIEVRKIFPSNILPSTHYYPHNAVYAIYTLIPAREVFSSSIGYLASLLRKSIVEQGTQSQITAFAKLTKSQLEATGQPLMFGSSSNQLMVFSNWSRGNFYETDFSAAVVKQGVPVSQRANGLGKPSYLHAIGHSHGQFSPRYSFPIFGRDAEGNYWLSGFMRSEMWPVVGRELEKMG